MKLKCWGVRGSIPVPGPTTVRYGGNTSCYQVTFDDPAAPIFMLDAGTGIREAGMALLGQAKGTPLNLRILFSHTHWDHINGFPFFVPIYIPGNRIDLYGPFNLTDSERSFKKVMDVQMSPDYFPVRADELGATLSYHDLKEGRFELDGVTVRCQYMNHPIQCLGYRLEHGGRSLFYTGDHEPYFNILDLDPEVQGRALTEDEEEEQAEMERIVTLRNRQVVEICRDVDVLLADAQYLPEEYPSHRNWGHSSVQHTLDLALAAQVKTLVLTHHEPVHTDDRLDAKLQWARDYVAERGGAVRVRMAREKEELTF